MRRLLLARLVPRPQQDREAQDVAFMVVDVRGHQSPLLFRREGHGVAVRGYRRPQRHPHRRQGKTTY